MSAPERWAIWGWSTVLSYTVELPTTASPVTHVSWSDGAAAFQPLAADAWWEEDGALHVTVPLRARTRIALSRGTCDLNADGTPDVFGTTPPPGVPDGNWRVYLDPAGHPFCLCWD